MTPSPIAEVDEKGLSAARDAIHGLGGFEGRWITIGSQEVAEHVARQAIAAYLSAASRPSVGADYVLVPREALGPIATLVNQMDRELPHAREGRVTIVHPLDGILPKLDGTTDHECPIWPLPDDLTIIDAWRYHDPQPISERMALQMKHLRALRDVLAAAPPLSGMDAK